jgi:hypothetical protein
MTKMETQLSGPFFKKDPGLTFRQNARRMARGMVLAGQADVQEQLAAGESSRAIISHGVEPPRVREHVVASVPYSSSRDLLGTTIKANVYVQNKGFSAHQARALMAAYSMVEQETGAFHQTTLRLWRAAQANVHELLRDIA